MSCNSRAMLVQLCDVPMYLRAGEFCKSLEACQHGPTEKHECTDEASLICVPTDCMKQDSKVECDADMTSLLKSLRFWLVNEVPEEAIASCLATAPSIAVDQVCEEFSPAFPVLNTIKAFLNTKDTSERLLIAARAGNLTMLAHAMSDASPQVLADVAICRTAARHGQLSCLMYARSHGCAWDEGCCIEAAAGGHLDCLLYLHDQGCPWNLSVCSAAASGGHLSCLAYAHEQGCAWGAETCRNAATAGSLPCLKYAHEHGCQWNRQTPAGAAHYGHLACLQYAHEQGCPWDASVCEEAAFAGQLTCLKYAHEQGCPWTATVAITAVEEGHAACLQYLLQRGCPIDPNLAEIAENCGSKECLALLMPGSDVAPAKRASVRVAIPQPTNKMPAKDQWDVTTPPPSLRIMLPFLIEGEAAEREGAGSKPATCSGLLGLSAAVAAVSVLSAVSAAYAFL
jgi:hypothetical protein